MTSSDYKPAGGHDQTRASAATKWLEEILADGEWHDADELTTRLEASDFYLSTHKGVRNRREAARLRVRNLAKRQRYEPDWGVKGNRRMVLRRIRKRPGPVGYLRTCAWCGAHNLNKLQYVRRTVNYWSPAIVTDKNRLAAYANSEHICLTCADKELAKTGKRWANDPRDWSDANDTPATPE